MKIRLLDLLCRPWSVSRQMIRALKDMHVNMEVVYGKPIIETKEYPSGYVTINSTFMIPVSSFKLIEQDIVVVESEGYGSSRTWKRKKNQDVSISQITYEQAIVMLVNERLDNANGN